MSEHTRLRAGRVDMTPGGIKVRDRGNRMDIVLQEDPATAFEVVTPVGRGWTWTRKLAIGAFGSVFIDGTELPVDGLAMLDENDGYHPRLTHWWWSGGTAMLDDGRVAVWSVIVGLNDTPPLIENTVWLDGLPVPIGPVTFASEVLINPRSASRCASGEVEGALERVRDGRNLLPHCGDARLVRKCGRAADQHQCRDAVGVGYWPRSARPDRRWRNRRARHALPRSRP